MKKTHFKKVIPRALREKSKKRHFIAPKIEKK